MQKIVGSLFFFLGLSFFANGQKKQDFRKDSIAVVSRMQEFLHVFDSLDAKRFQTFFEESATVFLESDTLTLVEGKAAILQLFEPLFTQLPKYSKGPPYLHLDARNLHVTVHTDLAVISFHFDRQEVIARRTVVWHKTGNNWYILHIHGSAVGKSQN